MISPGLRIGRYEVGKRLGRGGFGVVHIARDVDLDRDVAIKVLKPEFLARPQIVLRFLQEARAAAKIGHAGIVTVFECGQIQGTNTRADGTAYIAMELLVGESLADRLLNGGRMSSTQAIAITRQLAAALGAAHAAGIVHRDLKPDNVFLVPDPAVHGGERVKILDFGVAKLMDPDEDGINTHSQLMLGTPKYMSPEQARSASKADHRSDLYTLGCLLFEMVTGRAPFSGGDAGDQLIAHQKTPPPSARAIVDAVPRAVDALIARLLAKSPDDRPQSAVEVIDALTDLSEPDTMVRPPLEPTPEPRLSTEITAVADPVRSRPGRRIGQSTMIVVGLGAALLSMLIVFIAMRGRSNTPKPTSVVVAIDAAPPPDAVAEISVDAAVVVEDDHAARLRLECAGALDEKRWTDLIACSEALRDIDRARSEQLYATAHAEMRAEASLRELDNAIKERSMIKAHEAFAAISTESVYRKNAEERYRKTVTAVHEQMVTALRKVAANCKAHGRLVAQLAATVPADLVEDASAAAPCEKPGAKATPSCEVDDLLTKGQDALASGNPAGAVGFFEAAYKCRPSTDILRRLLLSTCAAKNLTKARLHYKQLTPELQNWMLGTCANKGIFQKDLEAP